MLFILPGVPSHDVLIIGAGLAGQRAALAAAQTGATVAIISKVHPVRSHSVAAAGGINAALNPEDTWESHAFDTIKGSDYLADQDAVEIMTREAPGEILWLEHAGVTFHRNERGQLGTRAFGGASAARTYYVADITGHAILHVLYEQLMKHSAVLDRYEEWFTTDLLMDDEGRCTGAICRNLRDGRLEVFNAKSTILATGGAGQAYRPTTNGLIVTGDGIAQAYRLGARLMDMEMIQYHPTTLAGNGLLITEGARGEGALGDQQPVPRQRRGVVLDHLHVHQLGADPVGLGDPVAGHDQAVGRRPVGLAGPAGGEDHRLGVEHLQLAVAQVAADRADTATVVVHEQVGGEPLLVAVDDGRVLHQLLVEHVQDGVAGDVGDVVRARRGGAAEGACAEVAALVAVEGDAGVLQPQDLAGRLPRHDLHRVLIGEVVGALDRVEGVRLPGVLWVERGVDAAGGGDGMGAHRVDLRDDRHGRARLSRGQRRPLSRQAGADDQYVM